MITADKRLIETLSHEYICGGKEIPEQAKEAEELFRRKGKTEKPVIYIGAATCGISAGADKVITKVKTYIEENKIESEIVEVGCIGLCAEEPIIDVQVPGKKRVSFRKVKANDVEKILEDTLKEGKSEKEKVLGQHTGTEGDWEGAPMLDDNPFFAQQTRVVLKNCGIIDPCNINEYLAFGGYQALAQALHTKTSKEVCEEVEESGLRGRGGGGFTTGTKWKFALNTPSEQKYIICNADEGDPGAFMDRAIIEGDPHKLLEGLAIAAYGIGASKAYIYIRAEYPLAIERLKVAISQAEEAGLLGENILDSGFNLRIIIKMGAGAFVCGEETALIHSIEGKRGMPRPRPPFPAVSGLFGKPSVINNVETLANIPEIIKKGKDWFAGLGTEGSKGTKVFALSGKIKRTGLVEVEMGKKLRDIVFDIGGGIENDNKYKAVQIGGPSGGCITEEHLDIEIDYESLKSVGAMMGSGGLVVMDEYTCMVDVAKFFMDFIQRESCGKCIPCREGTKQMLSILENITRGRTSEGKHGSLERMKGVIHLNRLAEVIKDTSLCGLGQTAPNPILSTLKWFRDEYDAHIYERKCPAGVCRELLTYKIIEDKCIGCTACARKCPTEAIKGAKKAPHYIIEEKCIGCGACMEACRFDAVEVE
jgi:NADH:ubiquinone oxidoreductase subunit F (NADH-binding)/Pyruvate/2-oxoacid:ferredoxin oxidoreductase delta subunit/(2Fe-2S) ferredoxin